MSYENIPDELKRIPNWLVWRAEYLSNGKTTKIPMQPRNGWGADVTNSAHLSSFEEAVNATRNEGVAGIGFAFTEHDEYGGIDYDNCADPEKWPRYEKILNAFDSYTEYSPSGNGLHTIIRACTPNGRRRDGVELYTSGRFFTFTGRVYGMPKTIAERQTLAMQLYNEMGNGSDISEHYLGDASPKHWDEEIISMAAKASNGALFQALMNGDWQSCGYPSQSEADQALMNIIVFYTKNRAQAARIFKSSGLGQREKAQRYKYLEYTMDKAFDQTLPPINFDSIINQINETIAANKKSLPIQQQQTKAGNHFEVDTNLWRKIDPPGVLGGVMHYFMEQAPRPLREAALTASIGLFAGICGRCYNVSNTGLNLYLMVIASTGMGKEAIRTGINSLMHSVAYQVMPAALDFLGPSDMASGAGLLKHLADRPMPSYVSLTGEVGLRMQQLSSSNANQADITLRKVLLDLYPASKKGGMIRPTVYSDKKNNIEMIYSPNFTWLGESTGSEFYKALSEEHIASGLLPRFTIVEYTGPRPQENENHAYAIPSQQLIEAMRKLCEMSIQLNQNGNVIDVAFTPEAKNLRKIYNNHCDNQMDATNSEPLKQLWNRADLKSMKIAALLAISVNPQQPTIDVNMMQWAISFVHCDVEQMVKRFENGEIGVSAFQEGTRRLASAIISHFEGTRKPSNHTEIAFKNEGCVSRSLLVQMTSNVKSFKENFRLLNEILIELEKQGVMIKLNKQEAVTRFNSRAELYQVANSQWFYDLTQPS